MTQPPAPVTPVHPAPPAPVHPAPPTPPPGKKGLPPVAWVGIGCGMLLIIGIVIVALAVGWFSRAVKTTMADIERNPEKAAAEMLVKLNPDLDMVRTDDSAGVMTFRTKDGKETTLSYKEIAEGRITVEDSEGNLVRLGSGDLSQMPAWVPRLPETTDETSAFHSENPREISGAYTAKSAQDPDGIEKFFEAEARRLGFSRSSRRSSSLNGRETRSLVYSERGRSLTVNLLSAPGNPVHVQVAYSENQ